jgi:preprotein translocase subunit YajC
MGMSNIILLVVLLGVFYALMILPQRKQQKARQLMREQLLPGAKILTHSGIFGQVVEVRNDVMVVELARDVEVEMDTRAVLRIVEKAPSAGAASES